MEPTARPHRRLIWKYAGVVVGARRRGSGHERSHRALLLVPGQQDGPEPRSERESHPRPPRPSTSSRTQILDQIKEVARPPLDRGADRDGSTRAGLPAPPRPRVGCPPSQLPRRGRERETSGLGDSSPTVDGGVDYSKKPAFVRARSLGRYFGPVSFVRDSQPHMTVSVAESGSGRGVVLAVIDLAVVTDVIARARVGSAGYGYAVNSRGTARRASGPQPPSPADELRDPAPGASCSRRGRQTRGELGDDRARP